MIQINMIDNYNENNYQSFFKGKLYGFTFSHNVIQNILYNGKVFYQTWLPDI